MRSTLIIKASTLTYFRLLILYTPQKHQKHHLWFYDVLGDIEKERWSEMVSVGIFIIDAKHVFAGVEILFANSCICPGTV